MKIAVLRERVEGETRVAATPETVARLVALGAEFAVETDAGAKARFPDADYAAAGATLGTAAAVTKGANVVLTVRRPQAASLKSVAAGALVIGGMDPFGHEADIAALADTGVTLVAMEFMPRITRAQVMDILSSQANLAGYQAVIDAAGVFERAMPMMMTAAGTVRPAKVFVMGAGVAGLQAIATARRLGAMVTATDVRAAAGEQVESLGAKFVMTEALKDASGSGGYARELTDAEKAAQSELVAGHISKQDIVITTALIPGRPAPQLVTAAMVASMAPGSVVVDLAAERGGNVALTKPDEVVVTDNGVTILGPTNMAGRLATSASQLYARNLAAFLETLIDKSEKTLAIDWEDELVKATVLTRDGAIVHPNIKAPKAAAAKPTKPAAAAKSAASKSATTSLTAPKTAAAKPAAAKKPATAKKPAARKAGAAKPAAASRARKPATKESK
ncbi:Re/Si-specific NAD(P)(+) transhydrogenase subunit alpha [Devosia sp.]|uniref:Re/Si-specific NAD(P)(+) transhydrogenase subunit alpha n=1 Tax=Devosia sp. TaxID=1871048 RepID=UPI003A92089E